MPRGTRRSGARSGGRAGPARRSGTGSAPRGRLRRGRPGARPGGRRPASAGRAAGDRGELGAGGRPHRRGRSSSGGRPRVGSRSVRLQIGESKRPAGQRRIGASSASSSRRPCAKTPPGRPQKPRSVSYSWGRGVSQATSADVAVAAVPERGRGQRPAAAGEGPEAEVAEVAGDRIARAHPLDLEAVARPEAIADRALGVINLFHPPAPAPFDRPPRILTDPRGWLQRPDRRRRVASPPGAGG